MNRLFLAISLFALVSIPAFCEDPILPVTICRLESHFNKYDGKMVRFRGELFQSLEIAMIKDKDCGVEFDYPDGPADLGPMASYLPEGEQPIPAHFKLERDAEYKKLVKYANEPMPAVPGCVCFACYRYAVTATFTGFVQVARPHKPGFGNMNAGRMRVILRSVSDVVPVDTLAQGHAPTCGPSQPPDLTMPRGIGPMPEWLITTPPPPFQKQDAK